MTTDDHITPDELADLRAKAIDKLREFRDANEEVTARLANTEDALSAAVAEVERLRGTCICKPPPITDGPEEDCPLHGRTYAEWVERADRFGAEVERLRAQVESARTRCTELAATAYRSQGTDNPDYALRWVGGQAKAIRADLDAFLRATINGTAWPSTTPDRILAAIESDPDVQALVMAALVRGGALSEERRQYAGHGEVWVESRLSTGWREVESREFGEVGQ